MGHFGLVQRLSRDVGLTRLELILANHSLAADSETQRSALFLHFLDDLSSLLLLLPFLRSFVYFGNHLVLSDFGNFQSLFKSVKDHPSAALALVLTFL